MFKDRRGVSEIVAGMILLMIVSILGILLYNIMVNTTSFQTNELRDRYQEESERVREKFTVLYAWKESNNVILKVLNYGELDVNITDCYFNGTRETGASGLNQKISTNEKIEISFDPDINPTTGNIYKIKVASNKGNTYTYLWEPSP